MRKKLKINNIFDYPKNLPSEKEVFEKIFCTRNAKFERIISTGQSTPKGKWLVQNKDEFVILLKGESVIGFEKGNYKLKKGDYLLIPAGTKHRVEQTSRRPECIWLAVHFKDTLSSPY